MVRSAAQLANVDEPAWTLISAQVADAPYPIQALAVDRDQGGRVLERLQATARSVLGALALESGGLLIDHAWLRILGGGSEGLPDLAAANELGDAETVSRRAVPMVELFRFYDDAGQQLSQRR